MEKPRGRVREKLGKAGRTIKKIIEPVHFDEPVNSIDSRAKIGQIKKKPKKYESFRELVEDNIIIKKSYPSHSNTYLRFDVFKKKASGDFVKGASEKRLKTVLDKMKVHLGEKKLGSVGVEYGLLSSFGDIIHEEGKKAGLGGLDKVAKIDWFRPSHRINKLSRKEIIREKVLDEIIKFMRNEHEIRRIHIINPPEDLVELAEKKGFKELKPSGDVRIMVKDFKKRKQKQELNWFH
ncbi:MAG: hypothetical protein J7L23_04855 [Candidatus Diapherotrites archaeon]|nr:hypothetical protein [Candidatus Diapherotrites archaeon]